MTMHSIDWKNEWFPIEDATYLNFAAHAAIERLPEGYRLASPRQASQRGVFGCIEVGSRCNTKSLYQTLRDERFVVALREGKIRIAPHLLNSTEDMDRLLVVMERARKEAGYVPHLRAIERRHRLRGPLTAYEPHELV